MSVRTLRALAKLVLRVMFPIQLRGARGLTLIVMIGTSQSRNENGTHGYLNLSISFLLMFSPDDFLAV